MKLTVLLLLSVLIISCGDKTSEITAPVEPLQKEYSGIDTSTISITNILFSRNGVEIGRINSGYIPELGNTVAMNGQFRFSEPIMISNHHLRLADLNDGEALRAEIDSLKQEIAELKSLIKRPYHLSRN